MTGSSITSFILTAALAVTLSACSEKELILKGERTAVLPALDFVTIDADAAGEGAQLGDARINRAFTHAGGDWPFVIVREPLAYLAGKC